MHAYLALAFAIAVPALATAATTSPVRVGYEREIEAPRFNFVLSDEYLASHKNRADLVTKLRPEELIASDNVIVESNPVRIVQPVKREAEEQASGDELVRRRRGYNLENVRVPARYPYLPVANFNRFRRWG